MAQPLALVAGAAGLVGSELCRQLLDKGRRVLALDNFITGQRQNLAELEAHPDFQLLEHDLCTPLPPLTENPDYIYHMASPASPEDFGPLALEIMDVNTLGTRYLLELAKKSGAKLLFASTSEVYGDPKVHPQPEDYWGHVNPVGPRACYDESKRFGESLITHYARLHNVNYVITRIFNTFGPRMRADDGRVVPNFLLAALKAEPLFLHGGGQQTRSFCFVSDLVAGLIGLMEHPESDGKIFNLGNPQEYTVEVLATTICEVAGIPTQLKSIPSPRIDDPVRRQPDISRVQALLGWEPQVGLREGLEETLTDFRARFGDQK